MARHYNKKRAAEYAMGMLFDLWGPSAVEKRADVIMHFYHTMFPDEWFDGVRPTDKAVWETALEAGNSELPTTSAGFRAWYAAYAQINSQLPFCFKATLLKEFPPERSFEPEEEMAAE